MTQEELGIVWLCGCTELDRRECAALLRAAASPARLLEEYEKIAPTVINSPKARLYKERGARFAAASQLVKRLEREGCFALTVLDDDYPEALRNIASPPLLLYGKGDRSLLTKRKFCIVGSRVTPPWAESLGKAIAGELASRFCIVTGLAEGGDSAAISGALPYKNLISVLPCGLKECYPASHAQLRREVAKKGLLLTEYPPATGVQKYSFHARNRLLAGLSEGVLVLAAGRKSGTLITADCAVKQGKELFIIPSAVNSPRGAGGNRLLKSLQGAMVLSPDDVAEALGVCAAPDEPASAMQLDFTEERILDALSFSEVSFDDLLSITGLGVSDLNALLVRMELNGLIRKLENNYYGV